MEIFRDNLVVRRKVRLAATTVEDLRALQVGLVEPAHPGGVRRRRRAVADSDARAADARARGRTRSRRRRKTRTAPRT
eukprot:CAMPEP_0119465056 /NCGR_PEP_ID=MMETSP1344-20130328/365_1 /TAXON_ID=236787 /ORGANISM="Florenciella parvula, Strain CCMP2471" /LENGTH=77 /DNA_ID=CAMNT_0007497297 /DNA_START=652 /DNA_END=881 /DNA_ORIENTATION=+